MEEFERAFFRPCTRIRDFMRDGVYGTFLPNFVDLDFEEVELLDGAESGAVDLLHPAFTFDNLRQLTRRKIV
jgi:hypothetical protein